MDSILKTLNLPASDNLLVGINSVDDAGVYRISPDMALVQSLDFFPPIVDDPYQFGQVAAANALSDVYAMGGRPITALNVVAFPDGDLPFSLLGDILRGGADKVVEAKAVIAGGHSVKDKELKYGLAVTGLIHPDRIVTNGGAKAGDVLLLTKPIGTGIVSTALKQGKAVPEEVEAMVNSMTALNRIAGEAMVDFGVHAATDITGFGLAGHAWEVARSSDVSMEIEFESLEILPGAIQHAKAGALTGGASANRDYLKDVIAFAPEHDKTVQDLIYDPQTSGGLFMALPEKRASEFFSYLNENGVAVRRIGLVKEKREPRLLVL